MSVVVRQVDGDLEGAVDLLLSRVWHELRRVRQADPLMDYSARAYFCEPCESLHVCVDFRVDLIDAYECPHCGQPQTPWTDCAP